MTAPAGIGRIKTTRDIPAGAVIHYDAKENALVVFDPETGQVFAVCMPFALPTMRPHPRAPLLRQLL